MARTLLQTIIGATADQCDHLTHLFSGLAEELPVLLALDLVLPLELVGLVRLQDPHPHQLPPALLRLGQSHVGQRRLLPGAQLLPASNLMCVE